MKNRAPIIFILFIILNRAVFTQTIGSDDSYKITSRTKLFQVIKPLILVHGGEFIKLVLKQN